MIYHELVHQSAVKTICWLLEHVHVDIYKYVGYHLLKLVGIVSMVVFLLCASTSFVDPLLAVGVEIMFLMWLHQYNPWYV